jgi:hypothetical protein
MLLLSGGAIVAASAGTVEERKRRQAQAERSAAAIGMAVAKLSGGWTLRRRQRQPSQRATARTSPLPLSAAPALGRTGARAAVREKRQSS